MLKNLLRAAVLLAFFEAPCLPALAADPTPAPVPPTASEISALRSEAAALTAKNEALTGKIDEINARLAALEAAKVQHQKTLDKVVTSGSFPGSFKLAGTDTSVAIHGLVSLQTFYDENQNLGDKFSIGNLAPKGNTPNQSAGSWHMHNKLSRLWVETRTPTSAGQLKTMVDADFYGFINGGTGGQQALQNNSYGFRMRQVYGQLGRFLAGMTNSNFIDDPDNMESLDQAGPAGAPGQRLPQIRYYIPLGKTDFSIAAENPVTDYADSLAPGDNEIPSKYNPQLDFTAKLETDQPWGHAQLSGASRVLAFDDGAGHRTTTHGGGVIAGGTFNLNQRGDNIGGQAWTGDGIMKYTPDDFGPDSSAQVDLSNPARPRIVASNEHGAIVYGQLHWSKLFRSNVGLGWNSMTWQDFIPLDASEPTKTRTLHLNTIYHPVPQADFGIEWMHGTKSFREAMHLADASDTRWEFSTRYKF